MSNQSRWPVERRLKYAELIKQSRPWKLVGAKTVKERNAVRWNKLQSGKQSAPVLAVRRLLYQTAILLKNIT
jgi:hypothetical protein